MTRRLVQAPFIELSSAAPESKRARGLGATQDVNTIAERSSSRIFGPIFSGALLIINVATEQSGV